MAVYPRSSDLIWGVLALLIWTSNATDSTNLTDPTLTSTQNVTDTTDLTDTDLGSPGGGGRSLDRAEHRKAGVAQDAEAPPTSGASQDAPEMELEAREIADYGLKMMNELYGSTEPELYKMGLWLGPDEPAGRVAAFSAPSEKARALARYGYAALYASRKLAEQLSLPTTKSTLSVEQRASELRQALRDTALHEQCPLRGVPRCRPAARRYRTSDGTCNNLLHPWWGASLTPAQRFLQPKYEDGIDVIRRSVTGSPLPSARDVSTRVHRDRDQPSAAVTLMLMQWGQLLDHDLTSTAQSRSFNGSVPRCCRDGGRGFQPPEFMHPDCLPIPVSDDDWFLSQFGIRCMEFIRSAPASRIDCELGWREQINQVTSFLDASPIYGSTPEQTDSLRQFRGGLLQYGRQIPGNPPDPPGGDLCRRGAVTSQCMRTSDGRFSEQPALTAIHLMFLREHNALAKKLSEMNPHWSDEKLFQETRRIMGAIVQHITYREFLPVVLGGEVVRLFDLDPLPKGYYEGYNPKVQPTPANAFTTAAYRFGHSLVQKSFVRSDSLHRPLFNNVSLHEEQKNAENIWSFGSLDRLLLGLCNQPSQSRDEFISEELTNHLFQSPGFPFGMDLAAINIQRGRDHGIPPYVDWRVPCGLSSITNWTDLHHVMSLETANRFRSLYLDVRDIDLFSGGMAERPVRGGLVGPTFACIIAQQFSNLRKGDRFWYENNGFESSFTPAQLQQIRKVTLSQIICETMEEVETIQPFVFLAPNEERNKRERCREFPELDLTPWVEINDGDNGVRRVHRDGRRKKDPADLTQYKGRHNAVIINLTDTDNVKHKTSYGTNYYFTPDYIPDRPTYRPLVQTTVRPYGTSRPTKRPTKRPVSSVTYVVNSDDVEISTPKPHYNVNIQINYFFNSTKPTKKPDYDDPEPYNPNPMFSYADNNFFSQIPTYNGGLKPHKQTVTVWNAQGIAQPTHRPRPNVYDLYDDKYNPVTQKPLTSYINIHRPNQPNKKIYYNGPSKYPKEPYVVQKSAEHKNTLTETELKDILDLHWFDLGTVTQDEDKKYVKISSNKYVVDAKTADDADIPETNALNSTATADRRTDDFNTVTDPTDPMEQETTDQTTNSTDPMEPTGDLETTYSEIFEQFALPDNATINGTDKNNATDDTKTTPTTLLDVDDELFSVELPRPMTLFDD